MRRAGVLIALVVASCGAPSRPSAPPMGDAVVDEAAGTRIVAVQRATRGRVWLSLWIDAGARDAEPPQVATLAAWATTFEHDELSARVLPDGIELARPCTRDALDDCLRSLAAIVSTRVPRDRALLEARRRLVDARRRAVDDARLADALAMTALLGRSVDPLGDADDDERASSAVASFLRDHVGAGRMLLIAVGDVEPSELRERVAAAFADVPRAREDRAPRSSEGERGWRVAVSDRDAIAAAFLRPNVSDAARIGRRLIARIDADHPSAHASADVFPLRGGAAVIARVEDREAARSLLDHIAELGEEPASDAVDPPTPEDGPRALARWLGARWVARQGEAAQGGLGVGVVVGGGRGDRVEEVDPDAAPRDAAERELERTLRSVLQGPPMQGTVDAEGADARLAGGAVLRAQRLPGASRATAVVLFDGGAAEDPPDAHGATALLTRLAQTECEAVARRELGHTLESLSLDVTSLLTASSWGLRVEGPSDRWREIAYLAPRCASVPYLEPALLEEARDSLLRVVRQPREETRGRAGILLAPSAPGRVAPVGSAQAVSGLSMRELRRAHEDRIAAVRARIALAGDVPIEIAARIVARGVARWPAGLPAEPGPWLAPTDHLVAQNHEDGRHEAVVAWMVEASPASEVVARAFARTLARALAGEPGLEPRWHEAGAQGGRAWSIVTLAATPDALDALPAHVARALRSVNDSWGEVASDAIADAAEERAWSASSPRSVAMALATSPPDPPTSADAQRVLRQLVESAPYFLILRPQPGR